MMGSGRDWGDKDSGGGHGGGSGIGRGWEGEWFIKDAG
jgi:hypothetical protein